MINQNQTTEKNQSLKVVFSDVFPFRTTKFERKDRFLIFYAKQQAFLYFFHFDVEFVISLIENLNFDEDLLISTLLVQGDLPFLLSLSSTSNNSEISLEVHDIFNNNTILNNNISLPLGIESSDLQNIDIDSVFDGKNNLKVVSVFSKNVQPQNVSGIFAAIFELSNGFSLNRTIFGESPFDYGDHPTVVLSLNDEKEVMLFEVILFYFSYKLKSRYIPMDYVNVD